MKGGRVEVTQYRKTIRVIVLIFLDSPCLKVFSIFISHTSFSFHDRFRLIILLLVHDIPHMDKKTK